MISSFSFHLFLLLLFAPSISYGSSFDPFTDKTEITYHDGPILTGIVNLVIIWDGNCGKIQKNVFKNFIKSLNKEGKTKAQPQVSSWWQMVESYQSVMPGAPAGQSPKIIVKVVKQVTTPYKYGKVLTTQASIPDLVKDVTHGDPNLFPVIVTARDVTVQGLCTGKCADHGIVESNKGYIVVGNPETDCPGACGWPFYEADTGPKGPILKPPNENMAADAMVIALATALADAVTSPQNSGFYGGNQFDPIGPGLACKGIFGTGAAPGNPGKVLTDPATGGSFNAYGKGGKRFLLPAIWNPKTSSCWTLM